MIYFLYEYNRRKKTLEKYSPNHNSNYTSLQDTYENKGLLVKEVITDVDSTAKIADYQSKIDNPIFEPFRKNFNAKKNQSNLKWYSIGTNLINLRDLAKELKRFELHDIVYQQYNNPTHGTDLMAGVFTTDDEGVYLKQIRDPSRVREVTFLAAQVGCLAFGSLARGFTNEQKEETHFRIGRYDVQHFRDITGPNTMKSFY